MPIHKFYSIFFVIIFAKTILIIHCSVDYLHFCANKDYYGIFFIIIMQPLNTSINFMKFWAEMGRNDIVIIVTTMLSILLWQYCRGSQCCCCDNVATILCLVSHQRQTSPFMTYISSFKTSSFHSFWSNGDIYMWKTCILWSLKPNIESEGWFYCCDAGRQKIRSQL